MKFFDEIIVKNPIPIVVFSKDRESIDFINESFTKFLGYLPEDVSTTKDWANNLYPDENYRNKVYDIWIEDINKIETSGIGSLEREFDVAAKDGCIYNVVFNLMLTDENIVLILKDVTDKKKLYEDRKEAETELDKLNRKLVEKNKELEQVVYVTSHDLRSPLINILGFSKELYMSAEELRNCCKNLEVPDDKLEKMKYILDEELPETTQIIRQSAIKMDSLLSALLKLSRSGRGAPILRNLDVNKIIDEIIKENQFILSKNNIVLKKGNIDNCFGDSLQINQIFTNLLTNAINYSDSSKDEKFISIYSYKKNNYVIYKVEDNGIGIKKDEQKNIFEIFKRINEVEINGDGLGLTIVKKLVDRHDGEIWVESEHGTGTTFFIKIPAEKAE
ncbi:MAG: GHKL domain-containing protein [Melioribacteraceae bacterium]|nr:GHKL domain-containing protein [Melioribacteraceae bacterium]